MVELRPALEGAARLYAIPRFIIDEAKLGHLLPKPVGCRVLTRDALARRRVLDEPLTVVNDCSAVKFVVEDAIAALRIAQKRRCVPPATAWPGCAVSIEIGNNGQRSLAAGVLLEDAPNNFGLTVVDCAPTALFAGIFENIVALALTTWNAPGLHPADLAAACFLGQVLQEQRRHRALQAHMNF